MNDIWKRVSSIGLVVVFVASLLMSFPLISAAPPDKCEPWPECKDGGGEEPPADPAIAYSKGNNYARLWVMNADGSNQAEVYNAGTTIHEKSWSPDGGQLAFDLGFRQELRTIDVTVVDGEPEGTNVALLMEGCQPCDPAWSPSLDVDEIAIAGEPTTRGRGTAIQLVSVSDGSIRTIYSAPDESVTHPSWSPDAASIAFVESDTIRILDVATETITDTLVVGQFIAITNLEWSRNGDKLAFEGATSPDQGGIYILDISTDTYTLVVSIHSHSPSWSPDDAKLVFDQREKSGNKVKSIDLVSGDVDTLSKGWSPDWSRHVSG